MDKKLKHDCAMLESVLSSLVTVRDRLLKIATNANFQIDDKRLQKLNQQIEDMTANLNVLKTRFDKDDSK